MASSSTPHAFINDQFQGYPAIKARVGGGAKFDRLNAHLRNSMVMPGQMMVVGDESTDQVTPDES